VIRCDSLHYCQGGMSCCQASSGQWNCCPYPLGQCCADGVHCCEYGYTYTLPHLR
uniref:Granulins domain-containing protein n=2 Tax=Haplochromini TaxID=319058 RepID=A0A3P9BKK2_9CICH